MNFDFDLGIPGMPDISIYIAYLQQILQLLATLISKLFKKETSSAA